MDEKTVGNNSLKTLNAEMHDAIIDGVLNRDIPSKMVYVEKQADLATLPRYPAGTIAAQYGFTHLWQQKPDGTWATIA